MTIYEIPNIEHCTVTPVNSLGYTIEATDGWYIHLNNGVEDTVNNWTTIVMLLVNTDWSIVDIRAKEDLPEDADTNDFDANIEQ